MESNWESTGNSLLEETFEQVKGILASPNWEQVEDSKGIKVCLANGPNNIPIGKSECVVPKPSERVSEYISNPNNAERWGDKLKKLEVKEEGQDIKLLYLQLKQNWPIEDREILYVEGIRKDEEAEYLLARSIPLDIPVEKKHTRGQLNLNCIKVEDIGNGNSKLSMLIQFHPCGSVPEVGLKNIQTGVVSFLASVKSSLT
mmetsp:Transcript_16444/g.23831  ORF Transcript_16444/g.23831 Transcript_16444/m.23831 type:complete len:201 (-) Transcript_16444:992-1594(-)